MAQALPQDFEDPKFEVVKIGAGNYRKLIVPEGLVFKCDGARYQDEEDDTVVASNAELDAKMVYEGDEWTLKLPVPAVFHKFIVGRQGQSKQQIEMQSGARVVIPKREDQEDSIQLCARQKQQIYSAKALVELLCEREESKLEYTHFLSLPLASDAKLREQVDQFKENVVLQKFPGIDASIFMPSKRLHFTVCMLRLHSHTQIEEMREALQEIESRIATSAEYHKPLAVNLSGLHIMTDDPSNTGVVFTTDRSSALKHRMDSLADTIFGILKARNLISQQNLMAQRVLSSDGLSAEVKMHATLLNAKYSRERWRDDGTRGEHPMFDASVLLERFGTQDFGTVRVKEMQLSCLDEMGDSGYYRCLHSIPVCKS